MNYDFIHRLDQAKTYDNASIIELIKKMYIECELCNDHNLSSSNSVAFYNMATGEEYTGEMVDDSCYVFNCANGTIRLTLITSSEVLVEVSATGHSDMYSSIGTVDINTGLKTAIEMGQTALNDDNLMGSVMSQMNNQPANEVNE